MTDTTSRLPSRAPEWQQVASLAASISKSLHQGSDLRFGEHRPVAACGIEVHGQRLRLTTEALNALHSLAGARGVERERNAMFAGEAVNRSEQRAALHVALRARDPSRLGAAIGERVTLTRARMRALSESLHAGTMRGSSGEPITDIVNIGIGGSDFGSRLLCDALRDLALPHLRIHFVSSVDGIQIERLCAALDPRRALFIVSSKSFGTVETLVNAETLMKWWGGYGLDVSDHWLAVTGNPEAARRLGIGPDRILDVPDWVGGRFSAWGAVGLPAALYLGWPTYSEWLAGGAEMDEHHRVAPLAENLPVRLALHNVWHSSFLGCPSHCIASYDDRLAEFLTWAQQLEMESNGKSVTADGEPVDYSTAPIVWGGLGNNGQHTYYQLLRQGTQRNAISLISVDTASSTYPENAAALARQVEAQVEALAARDSRAAFNSVARIRMRDLTPRSLGGLMAAFEHATTAAAWVWGINPFDQPGVELGKSLARQ